MRENVKEVSVDMWGEFLDLKGLKNRNLLLSNRVNLNEVEKQELSDLLKQSPCLTIAYELKEELREIYETSFKFFVKVMGLKTLN
jgi:Transposase